MRRNCLVPGVPAAASIYSPWRHRLAVTFSRLSALTVAPQLMQQTHLPTFLCGLSEMDFSSERSRLGVRRRQDTLRRGRPLMGWFYPGSRLSPQLKESRSGFSVSSIGTSEKRGQKKCPHFYPHAASVHLDISYE